MHKCINGVCHIGMEPGTCVFLMKGKIKMDSKIKDKIILIMGTVMLMISIRLYQVYQQIKTHECPVTYAVDPNFVMPPCEAQARMRDQGYYDGPIDSDWGLLSEDAFTLWSIDYYDHMMRGDK